MTKKEGAAASSALLLWVARFVSGNGISPCKTALSRSPQAPSLFRPALVKVSPGMRDFSIRQRTKNGCSLTPHPFPKQLISFSAGNLRESLRGPQPSQLFFVSRRPAHPAVSPPPGDARRGRSPFAFLPQAGACTPPRSDFSIRQRTKNGCSLTPHPFPKQLISFSAGNLRESLRGPQTFQLSFVSRRPARRGRAIFV